MNRLAVGAAFILGVGAGWIIQGKQLDIFFTAYLPALTTLLAAFLGAKYAFDFQRNKERQEKRKANIINGNNATFNIMRMSATLLTYRKTTIDPVRGKPSVFLAMKPTLQQLHDDFRLNHETLYFLLETPNPNLLNEIMAEEGKYRYILAAINERSRIHTQEVQPALERAGIARGIGYSAEQIEAALGPRLYLTLNQTTDNIIDHVDKSIIGLRNVGDKLYNTLKKLYPSETIIAFSIAEENDVQTNN